MDRTLLILDIFAARAITSEVKIQVELAQLRYRSAVWSVSGISFPSGRWNRNQKVRERKSWRQTVVLSYKDLCFEAGIIPGGETQELIRSSRARGNMKTAAIVGYTNAGKSTLLNNTDRLRVYQRINCLLLDPTTRLLNLKDGQILLTDTVGFIHKLPHHLVKHSRAHWKRPNMIILSMVDSSNPQAECRCMHVVYETLKNWE